MRYYQPQKYTSEKAIAMLENKGGKYIATQKNDGEWARLIKDMDGNITIQSRTISTVTGEYGIKTNHVPHIVNEANMMLPNGTVLLGELCFADISTTSQKVGTILRCLPEKAVSRQTTDSSKLRFKVFDCLASGGDDITNVDYQTRLTTHAHWYAGTSENYYMECTNFCFDNFDEFLYKVLEQGGEGIVIYDKSLPYMPGNAKAWTTLKVKKITEEIELPVIAVIEPILEYGGNNPVWECNINGVPVTKRFYHGWKNGVVVNLNGTAVRVTSGTTDDDAEWLASDEAAALISEGKLVAVVQCMEITVDGSMRHPRLVRLRTEAK